MDNRKLHKNLIFSQPAWQRFGRSTSGKIGLILTVALIVVAVLAPLIYPYNPAVDRDYLSRLVAPSVKHWFGTDGLGRDLLVRVWHGLGISLLVSLVSVGAGLFVGSLLGLLAGYFRGWVEGAIGILADILLAFPSILLAIAIVTVTGPSLQSVIIAVSVVQIPIYIRLTRSMVLSLREQEFVLAVKALGASDLRIIFRHILPGSLAPLVVQATLSTGTATLEAAGLGFLGLGAQPPAPELGTMLSDAFKGGYALSSPWTILFPGLLITLTVLGFNLLGDGLRDVLDPRGN
ncbi:MULTISPECIES: ABC transporter permease [unclassified Microcoleus]|uniref:ABC transporter permease n=1 Tax=unclassified Microcoleus TaxID=2642155 RepID=UPI001D544C5F|nr:MULTISPECIES: ABC transporter permease [unclassified Microcoleus]TAG02737.1 MAG: ABC transporter permease [Oscillatoriales cyanobacterium]MCC3412118.1 ABC transporter permease [Microcoleus sp. PH2017_02_FOX_O_A]MCC3422611.1 ABC transporter permease [Microcoleus sp. PH2017_01_SCD_O_A]MCC3434759.1 ABC transporter permease [Microcoleus sp. PH2017_05_CCC_O_A]MCC3594065.1 ABC transporter permease [Microcoleus sp. PH2017_28_MFU_U_A]